MDAKDLSAVLKALQSNMYYLAQWRVEFYKEFNISYHNCEETTSAAKMKHAEITFPELYQCRQIMKVVYEIMSGIRSQISIYKKEQ